MFCVCTVYVCHCVPIDVYQEVRECEGAFFSDEGTNLKTTLSHFCPHWLDTVIACQSSPHPTFLLACQFDGFFFFSIHLLITLCTQLTQIKEQLQSRSRKLELKGFSLSLSTSPSLLISRHFSSNSSGEPSAE